MPEREEPEMPTTTDKPRRDTTAATEASRRTFAKRRADKAIAELTAQGYTIIPPASA
jgi:hypothetical protein